MEQVEYAQVKKKKMPSAAMIPGSSEEPKT